MNLKPIFKLFSLKGIGQTVIQRQMSTFVISLGVLLLALLGACGQAPIAEPETGQPAPGPNPHRLLGRFYRFRRSSPMKKIFVLATLVLAFVLAACGPITPNAAPADAATKPAEATTAAFPTGKFLREDSKSNGLQFNEDGTFVVLESTSHLVEGTYSVKGDVYTEESNNAGCPTPMQYKYTFDGINLKFQPVEDPTKDPCAGRKGDFNETVTWVLTQ